MRCRVVCKENYTLNILCMHPIQLSSVQNQWLNSPSILVEYDQFQSFLVFPWQVGISPECTLKLVLKGHCETSAVQTEKPARSSTGASSRWRRLGEQGGQAARCVRGLADPAWCPMRGSSAGQPLTGSHSPLSSTATGAADLQSTKIPATR